VEIFGSNGMYCKGAELVFSACVGPLVAFSQCGIAYCNVLVMKNIENKIMNYEL